MSADYLFLLCFGDYSSLLYRLHTFPTRRSTDLIPATDADLRLARVLYDQLRAVPVEPGYLPAAEHPALVEVLTRMRAAPEDHRSLAQWAASVHMTERTLARHCQRELGMGLGEWRQRMRYLLAIDALEAGLSVQQIAYDLGYSTPSAFIAMFQREAGTSPEQFRREFCMPP